MVIRNSFHRFKSNQYDVLLRGPGSVGLDRHSSDGLDRDGDDFFQIFWGRGQDLDEKFKVVPRTPCLTHLIWTILRSICNYVCF